MGSSKSVTIGYRYFLGVHMVVCLGPVNSVNRLVVGERVAWSGNVTGSGAIEVNAPELFGGEKKEGGVEGPVSILFGEETQVAPDYLLQTLGPDQPSYRGVLSMVAEDVYLAAMSPYPKPWAWEVTRFASNGWYDGTREPANGSANAAHIIREVLLDSQYGLGLPETIIDDESFRAAADVLHGERFGLSLLFNSQSPVYDFIQQILTHVNGALYQDFQTGKFTLVMIRESTQEQIDAAPTFDEDNILDLESFERPSFGDLVNEVIIQYRRQGELRDTSVTAQDLASVSIQEAVISQTLQFPGIDSDEIAGRVAERELNNLTTPLAQCRFVANRDAWNLRPGQIIKLRWLDLGINQIVMRVTSVNYGSLDNGQIRVDCIEDIFSLPNASYIVDQPTEWTDPVDSPQPVPFQQVYTLPYWEYANNFSPGDIESFGQSTAFAQVVAAFPPVFSTNYHLVSRLSNFADFEFDVDGLYTPTAVTSTTINQADGAVDGTITITYSLFNGNFRRISQGNYIYIGDEVFVIAAPVVDDGTLVLNRGAFDTLPKDHPQGTRIWFAESNDTQSTVEAFQGQTFSAKVLVQTSLGILSEGSTATVSAVLNDRFDNEYPPKFVRFNNELFPPSVSGSVTNLSATWRSQDKTMQVVKPIEHWFSNTGTILPTGLNFRVTIVGEDGVTELRSEIVTRQAMSSNYSYTYLRTAELSDSTSLPTPLPAGYVNQRLTITIIVVTSTLTSSLNTEDFEYTVERDGWGYNYGNFYGGS